MSSDDDAPEIYKDDTAAIPPWALNELLSLTRAFVITATLPLDEAFHAA